MFRQLVCVVFAISAATATPLKVAEPLCAVCRTAVKEVPLALRDGRIHDKIIGELENICAEVTSERKDVCKAVINGLTQDVLQHLMTDMQPIDLCVAMTVCPIETYVQRQPEFKVLPARVHVKKHLIGARQSPIDCELCELIVKLVDSLLKNKVSPSAANATVMRFCMDLPEPTKDTCLTFAILIVDAIVRGVDPVGACTNIGLCLTTTPVKVGEPLCAVCRTAVKEIPLALRDGRIHNKVIGELENVCAEVTSERKDACRAVINGLTQDVLQHLMTDMQPIDLCVAMTVCPIETYVQRQPEFKVLPARVHVKKHLIGARQSPIDCYLCELIVQLVDNLLKNKVSPSAANATMMTFCRDLPEQERELCTLIVPFLVSALANGVDPVGACTNFGLCLTSLQSVPARISEAGPLCPICELIVQTVDAYLQNNKSEAAINATVYKVCNSLPGTLKDTCLGFAPMLVAALSKGLDPQKACTAIKLCTSGMLDTHEILKPDVPTTHVSDTPEAGPMCTVCELIVQTVDAYLQNNKSEAAINATVYKVCNSLPGTLKITCLGFAPMLVQALSKGLDPQKACTAIKLCTSDIDVLELFLQAALTPTTEKEKAGPLCTVCELIVQTVDAYLQNNKSEAAINATVYKVCNSLPGTLKITCLGFAPMLVQALMKGLDPQKACTAIKLCTSDTDIQEFILRDASKAISVGEEAGPLCTMCELIVQTVDAYLQNNKSEAAINATVYKVCNSLPGTLKITCLGFAPMLVEALSKGFDPQKACTAIKLCTSEIDAKELFQEKTPTRVTSEAGPLCAVCELIVQTVDAYLQNNKSEAAINATVYKVCNSLPGTLKITCLGFAPMLVQALSKGLDPQKACTAIKLCTSETDDEDLLQLDAPISDPIDEKAGPLCTVCELIVQTVDAYLQNNKSEAAINATVYKVCNSLPGTLKITCLGFAPMLVQALSKGLDPQKACTAIKLCTSDNRIQQDVKELSDEAGPLCTMCELIVQTVDAYLQNNKSEAAINATVYKVCNSLPGTLKITCLGFAPMLVEALSKGLDPQKACTAIKLCTSEADQPQILARNPEAGPLCAVCELIVQTVDAYLQTNKSEAAINATVYKVCNSLPGTLKITCLGFAPMLVQALMKGLDPQKACTAIKLCTSDTDIQEFILRDASKAISIGEEAGPLCTMCELIVQTVDAYLQNNKSEAAINATVYKVCNSLPGTLKDTCLAFAPMLVQALSKGLDPQKACTAIKLCTSGQVQPEIVVEKLEAGPLCTVCELIVQTVDAYLQNNKSEAAINATVYKVCNSLPGTLKITCLGFAPMLVQALSKGLDPQKACTAIKLCTSETDQPEILARNPEAGPLCTMCELIVQTVDAYLQNNKSEAAINATVYKVCNSLPGTLKITCLGFAPMLVQALSKGFDPQKACTMIKLCTSDTGNGILSKMLLKSRTPIGLQDIKCDVCKNAVGIIDQDLYREEDVVKTFLDNICDRLPPPTDTACSDAADKDFPLFWEKFLNGTASADNICKLLKACS